MGENRTIWVGLPAYNEEVSLSQLLPRFEGAFPKLEVKILVYCDGCTDKTEEVVRSFEGRLLIEPIVCAENKGLGQGVRTLLDYAIANGRDCDVLFLMDADDTHNPAQIVEMLEVMDKKNADVVITSRYRRGADIHGVPLYRQFLSIGALLVFKILHPVANVLDYTCGYRGYRVEVLKKLKQKYGDKLIINNGFPVMAELLLKLKKVGVRFAEVPLHLRYDRRVGFSKMNVSGYSRKLLILAFRWRIFGIDSKL